MTPDGVKIELDELATIAVKAGTKREIIDKLAEAWIREHGREALGDIMIKEDELKRLVLDKLASQIVAQWAANNGG